MCLHRYIPNMFLKTASISKLIKSVKNQSGFTLIELLVVIGILGILASALIATIDPFEQLRKASDSNIKNTSVEYTNASLRYFTTHNAMPWDATSAGGFAGCELNDGTVSGLALTSAAGAPCVTAMIVDGELKSGFASATNILKEIYISGTSNSITACFRPQSKAQQRDPNTKYDSAGSTANQATCKSAGSTADCYWCAEL